MKKTKKNVIIFIIIFLVLIVLVPCVLYLIYKLLNVNNTWQEGEILAYCGTAISAIATAFLGGVAIWQNNKAQEMNKKLLKIEEDNYIANYSTSAFVSDVRIEGVKQQTINLNGLQEQLLVSDKYTEKITSTNYATLELWFDIVNFEKTKHAAFVNISKIQLYMAKKDKIVSNTYLFVNDSRAYSQVAISIDKDRFYATVILTPNEKISMVELLKNEGVCFNIEIFYTLMTDKYVASKCQCRAILYSKNEYNGKQEIYNVFGIKKNEKSRCFYLEQYLENKENIEIKKYKRPSEISMPSKI